MGKSLNSYTMLLQNCSTKQVWIFDLKNISDSTAYYEFDFDMPEDAPFGEYNYFLFWSTIDTTITIKNNIHDSIVQTGDYKIRLADIAPETGIIKYLTTEKPTLEYDKKTDFMIYGKH